MGGLAYRLRCSWRSGRGLAVATAVVVAVVGGIALALVGGAIRTLSAPDRYTDAVGRGADAMVAQHGLDDGGAAIRELTAIRSVESASFVFGGLVPEGGDEPVDAIVFAGTPAVSGDRIVAGSAPERSHPGDFCASAGFVDRIGGHIGQRFTLVTIAQASADRDGFDAPEPDGPVVAARLVCTMSGPSELQEGYAIAVFPVSLLDEGDIGIADTVHLVDLVPGTKATTLQEDLDAIGEGSFQVQPSEVVPDTVRSAVQARGIGILVVATIVGIAALVVGGQFVSRRYRLTGSERTVLGAVGLTPRQLAADPVVRAALPVAAGAVAAALLAVASSRWFPLGFVDVVEPSPGWRVEPAAHLLGPVVITVGVLTWTAVAVRGPTNRSRRRVGSLDPLGRRVRPLAAAIGGHFLAYPGEVRTALASFVGLVLLATVAIGSLTFGASVDRLVGTPAWFGSSDVMTGQGGTTIPPELLDAIRRSDAVRSMALAGATSVTIDGRGIDVVGITPERGDFEPVVLEGRAPVGADEIAFGRISAADLGLRIGDRAVIRSGALDVPVRVVGLVVVPGIDGADGVGQDALVTGEGLRRLEPGTEPNTILAVLRTPLSTWRPRFAADTGGQAGPGDPPSSIVNLDRIRSLPVVLAGCLAAFAALTLAHQLLTTARRRRTDQAVLGALGGRPWWRSSIVGWQALLLAVATVAIAVPLGIIAARVVYRSFVGRIGAVDRLTVPVGPLVVVVATTLVVSVVVAAPAMWSVRRAHLADDLTRD
ncbi:hypothetical protein [Dermatobacter hominis]|uniref:hypothetical protein n=1 Tax=Dermatobacter hominis TaxID=2884263 RepID=UPI001D0FF04D|nr:hypothetical protein [Dermatobacter hominis]UDY36515.1 hypothetical protein LH044_03015 [Dermatobacter hominis]